MLSRKVRRWFLFLDVIMWIAITLMPTAALPGAWMACGMEWKNWNWTPGDYNWNGVQPQKATVGSTSWSSQKRSVRK
jgi:hypothetical protein